MNESIFKKECEFNDLNKKDENPDKYNCTYSNI